MTSATYLAVLFYEESGKNAQRQLEDFGQSKHQLEFGPRVPFKLDMKQIEFGYLTRDAGKTMAETFGITEYPTVCLFSDGVDH